MERRRLTSLFFGGVIRLDEDLKRNIRESLVYAVYSSLDDKRERRLVVSEFFNSLNRKMVLFNCEVEGEIGQANVQLEDLETT